MDRVDHILVIQSNITKHCLCGHTKVCIKSVFIHNDNELYSILSTM